jgi:hypothetical protein
MGDGQHDTNAMMQAALTQLTGMVSGLQGEVQRLQAQLGEREQAPAPPPQPEVHVSQGSKLKLPIPDKYDSSSQAGAVENFVFKNEQYFLGMGISADKQVYFASGLLSGAAATWWRFTCLATQDDESLYDWETFKDQLLARFQVVNSARHARDQLAGLVQNGSVRAYATKMQELALQIPDISEEGELKDRFIRGLKRRTHEAVVMREPGTFDEAVKLADRYMTPYGVPLTCFPTNLADQLQVLGPRPTGSLSLASTNPMPPRTIGAEPVPMEIDTLRRKPTPLTATERSRLMQAGGCFYCRQLGYRIADCPNKPPTKVLQRSVAQVESTAPPEAQPDLIDLGDEPRGLENYTPL